MAGEVLSIRPNNVPASICASLRRTVRASPGAAIRRHTAAAWRCPGRGGGGKMPRARTRRGGRMIADPKRPFAGRRLTVAEYHALIDAGTIAEDERVELIHGELVEKE